MKKIISLSAIMSVLLLCLSFQSFAAVGNNIDNDFESDWIPGWFQSGEGHGFSIVTDSLNSANHELKSNSTTAYNALYFGEYADNVVFQFDYKPNVATGETWGGVSVRCGSSGRYDIGLNNGTAHQSRVRIWRAGVEVAYNIHNVSGKGVPELAPLKWSRVKVALQGGRIRIFVNDMLVIDYTDSSPLTSGGFGFRASNADVSYDNVKFYPVSSLSVLPMSGYTDNFSTDKLIAENPYNAPPYFASEGNPFVITDGVLLSPDKTHYNAVYFGAAQYQCEMNFDFRDYGDGENTGGVSLNSWTLNGGIRYDISISSNDVEGNRIVIYRGGEEVASNSDEVTGKSTPDIPLNEWVRCKIVQDYGNIKVYVSDVLCVDYTDSQPLTGGYYGFRAVNSIVGYDNLSFTNLGGGVPSSSDSSSVTSSNSVSSSTSTTSIDGDVSPSSGDSNSFFILLCFLVIVGGIAFPKYLIRIRRIDIKE